MELFLPQWIRVFYTAGKELFYRRIKKQTVPARHITVRDCLLLYAVSLCFFFLCPSVQPKFLQKLFAVGFISDRSFSLFCTSCCIQPLY